MREKLIELINRTKREFNLTCPQYLGTVECCLDCKYYHDNLCDYSERFAEHLIQNGVVVLPCKVGDKVYYITAWDEYADQNDHEQEVQRIRITRHETYFDLSNLTTLKLKDYGLWWYTDKEKWLKAKKEYRNNKREAEQERKKKNERGINTRYALH